MQWALRINHLTDICIVPRECDFEQSDRDICSVFVDAITNCLLSSTPSWRWLDHCLIFRKLPGFGTLTQPLSRYYNNVKFSSETILNIECVEEFPKSRFPQLECNMLIVKITEPAR